MGNILSNVYFPVCPSCNSKHITKGTRDNVQYLYYKDASCIKCGCKFLIKSNHEERCIPN